MGGSAEQFSDEQLIDAARAGDVAAFEQLYTRYRDWVWRVARRSGADEELAADAVQETFLHLLDRLQRFELRAQLKSYLYPVARHLVISMLRKRRETVMRDPPESADEQGPPMGLAGEDRPLAAALGALPLEQREVLILRYADELSLQEIAAAVEVPLGTVKSRLHNALAALRCDESLKKFFES